MSSRKATMAIAYDFDGTLADGNMQEHQFLPEIGMTPEKFWGEVKKLTRDHQADEVLIYMHLMLKEASNKNVPVRKQDFKERGKGIALFKGVDTWFQRINAYARTKNVNLKHYLISSGNEEIFSGTKIARHFDRVYASKFIFDENGAEKAPALAINYTTKTQFLFRINKGIEDVSDNASVNRYTPKSERVIPFENIVFIGDGTTDIPCFRLVKDQGGLSIAVYKPGARGGRSRANDYLDHERVHASVPANYSENEDLEEIIKAQIDIVSSRHKLNQLLSSKTTKPRKRNTKIQNNENT